MPIKANERHELRLKLMLSRFSHFRLFCNGRLMKAVEWQYKSPNLIIFCAHEFSDLIIRRLEVSDCSMTKYYYYYLFFVIYYAYFH